ncbi:WD repeat-containing protein jip5 [Recurvomyces mirabilis]|uniref:WD repeat-containing protein JIP5 n=1 Tax=Recurvomyces mirabilis TaxID=574656 RepID=A0AAE1C1S0_9PEZI|nr:WD repeat-containing protein jip5 [Recurvomyces mirabilis]KAK5157744.1 WD repeat-containing protein jip5 [Recurvomyces mirabilis]
MFDTICSLPLTADLFAQTVHPTAPIVSIGLSSGHVATLRLPPVDEEESAALAPSSSSTSSILSRRGSNGTSVIDTAWRTKRHRGSCRSLSYSLDGAQLYSAGSDGLVKAAELETGRVTGKIAVPASRGGVEVDAPSVVHALSPQTLLVGTDAGALHLFDLRDPAPSLPLSDAAKTAFVSSRPAQTHHPHTDEYISSLSHLPPSTTSTSGFSKQWLTTGGTTLALTDLRRGVLVKSEDQEEILMSSLYVTGLPAKKSTGSSGEKALVGGGDGVITLWEKGQWDDQDERITVSREKETVDVIVAVPEGLGGVGKKVAVGLGDGKIRFVRLGQNQVVSQVQHDDLEGVVGLGFDANGRMISGGGPVLKVWREHVGGYDDDGAAEEDEEGVEVGAKRLVDSDDEDEEGGDKAEESSEEEEKPRKRRKKRKRGKGPEAGSTLSFAGLD